jgi:hypothetical protein
MQIGAPACKSGWKTRLVLEKTSSKAIASAAYGSTTGRNECPHGLDTLSCLQRLSVALIPRYKDRVVVQRDQRSCLCSRLPHQLVPLLDALSRHLHVPERVARQDVSACTSAKDQQVIDGQQHAQFLAHCAVVRMPCTTRS